MITVSVQLVLSVGICFGAIFTALGISLERLKVRQEQVHKLVRKAEARRTMPVSRVCGEFVWRDGKRDISHHCVLEGEDHYIHRAANGMGRKTYA